MDNIVNDELLEVFQRYKDANNLFSNNSLARNLGVSPSMISLWHSRPGMKIQEKVWIRIKDKLNPYFTETVMPDEKTIKELEAFDDDESDHYIAAKLAQDLGRYKEILPEQAIFLNPEKKNALRKIIEAALEIM